MRLRRRRMAAATVRAVGRVQPASRRPPRQVAVRICRHRRRRNDPSVNAHTRTPGPRVGTGAIRAVVRTGSSARLIGLRASGVRPDAARMPRSVVMEGERIVPDVTADDRSSRVAATTGGRRVPDPAGAMIDRRTVADLARIGAVTGGPAGPSLSVDAVGPPTRAVVDVTTGAVAVVAATIAEVTSAMTRRRRRGGTASSADRDPGIGLHPRSGPPGTPGSNHRCPRTSPARNSIGLSGERCAR